MSAPDEFETIARLLGPLAANAPEALGLEDDAAVISARPGFDLIITKDAIVEGVHFLPGTPLDLVARKLLRVNLSDLAAKGATPYGYFLACAWPDTLGWEAREAFARGLYQDQTAFGLKLFGGDTTTTPGPLVLSATLLGWVKEGAMVRRRGARARDLLQVSGPIGHGWLGLQAALGRISLDPVLEHYQTPKPRLDVSLAGATAAADVSDGLIADAGHIAKASGVGLDIVLESVPLSRWVSTWLGAQSDTLAALVTLVTGGDDYQIVATAPQPLPGFFVIGAVRDGEGVSVTWRGQPVPIARTGWRHGNLG